jgi:hypothetical protein
MGASARSCGGGNWAGIISRGQGRARGVDSGLLNKKASPDTSVIARPGKDFVLKLQGTTLHFDSGRLNDFTFDADFDFAAPIAAFREPWQNLDVIGELRIAKGMRKPAFLNYFAAWEARAKQLGAQRQEGSGLLKAGEYRVEFIQNNFTDMIHVSLGPERSTGRGGTWGSSLSFSFVKFQSSRPPNVRPGTLKSASVFCDEFNTCAR